MWPNPEFPADLVTFTAEILNGKKTSFLCSKMQYFFQSYHSVLIIKVIRIYQIGNNGPRNEKERILKSWKNFILINAKTFVNWFLSLRGSLYETFARFGTTI